MVLGREHCVQLSWREAGARELGLERGVVAEVALEGDGENLGPLDSHRGHIRVHVRERHAHDISGAVDDLAPLGPCFPPARVAFVSCVSRNIGVTVA